MSFKNQLSKKLANNYSYTNQISIDDQNEFNVQLKNFLANLKSMHFIFKQTLSNAADIINCIYKEENRILLDRCTDEFILLGSRHNDLLKYLRIRSISIEADATISDRQNLNEFQQFIN